MKNLFLLIFIIGIYSLAFGNGPIALLIVTSGDIEYRKNGDEWKKSTGTNFIYEGDYVKTLNNGKCLIINQKNISYLLVNENSEIFLKNGILQKVRGTFSELNDVKKNLVTTIYNKYKLIEEYSSVSRSIIPKKRIKLFTVENLTISDDYPCIVWENIGSEFSFQLNIENRVFNLPASENEIIRYCLPKMKPGEYEYSVCVFRKGKRVYKPEKNNKLIWQSISEMKICRQDIKTIKRMGGNGLIIGSYMDDKGLKVAAMDIYKDFFTNNPDNNKMRPFLIKIYNDLKLKKLRKSLDNLFQNYTKINDDKSTNF